MDPRDASMGHGTPLCFHGDSVVFPFDSIGSYGTFVGAHDAPVVVPWGFPEVSMGLA